MGERDNDLLLPIKNQHGKEKADRPNVVSSGFCPAPQAPWERILWEYVAPFLIFVHIALNPFPHTTSIREFSYYSAVGLLIFYFFRYRDWRAFQTPLTLPVSLFTVWSLISLFWSLDIASSAHDIRAHLIKYIILFLLLTVFFSKPPKIRLLFWAIIVSVLVSGWHDMYNFYIVGKAPLLTRMCIPYHELPVGPLGFMALFSLVLIVHLWRTGTDVRAKYVLALCAGGLMLIVLATQMRSLLIALPLCLPIIFWDNKKVLIVALLIAVACLYIFSTQVRSLNDKESNLERLSINYMSFLMFKEHPLTGIGFSMDAPAEKQRQDYEKLSAQVPPQFKFSAANYSSPHNIWLGLALRLGVVGLLFFTSIIVTAAGMCLVVIHHSDSRELRLTGQLCLSLLLLFSFYGLFNEIFMHLLETLFCVLFFLIAYVYSLHKKRDLC